MNMLALHAATTHVAALYIGPKKAINVAALFEDIWAILFSA